MPHRTPAVPPPHRGRAIRPSAALAATALTALLAGLTTVPAAAAPARTATAAAHAPATAPRTAAPTAWLPATPQNWPQVVDYTRTPADTVTRGVTHYSETYDTLGGRQHTQVLSVDLGDPDVRVGVVQAGDVLTDPADETVSSMAGRTHAVAGVNGDYFEIHGTGRPIGGVISDGRLMKTPKPGFAAQLGVKPDGSMVMGPETFTGGITDGTASRALTSVNTVNDLASGGITEVTPDLGASTGLTSSTLVLGHGSGGSFTVDSVASGVTAVDRLPAGETGLLGAGAGGDWLASTVHAGDTVALATSLAPDNDLTQLISGVTTLVKDGAVYDDPTGTPPGGTNPETAIGISRDGRHTWMVTLDGRAGESSAFGVTPAQVAGWFVAHGAYTAELFDGGGSTEMVTRRPGDSAVSVANTPSDTGNAERPVGDGVFVYTTATAPGAPAHVVVGGGRPVTTVTGGSVPVAAYATDRLGNPATTTPQVRVVPSSLATWSAGRLIPLRAGTGRVLATAGGVTTSEPLRVVDHLAGLTVTPGTADLAAGATQQFTLSGTTPDGTTVTVPPEAADWSTDAPGLGGTDPHGLFTASTTGGGMATVTAAAAGARATASVAVGYVSSPIDPMSDTATWRLSNNTTGQPATLTAAPGDVPPGSTASGSLRLDYTMPAGTGVKQLVMSCATRLTTRPGPGGQQPAAIGLWVKGDGGGLELAESYLGVDGVRTTLYPTYVTFHGWQLVVAQLPAGLAHPLDISFVDFLAISPSTRVTGTLNVGGLSALYTPRPLPGPVPGTPVRDSSWLRYAETPGTGADTLVAAAGARLTAAQGPAAPGAAALTALAGRLGSAPAAGAQFLGDMSADGAAADLTADSAATAALGVPGHHAVGAGETGGTPENTGFAAVLGATHHAWTAGGADVLVTDSAHGGLLASDAYQSPKEPQYPWIVQQLTDTTARTVVVATALPAYAPDPAHGAQFDDAGRRACWCGCSSAGSRPTRAGTRCWRPAARDGSPNGSPRPTAPRWPRTPAVSPS